MSAAAASPARAVRSTLPSAASGSPAQRHRRAPLTKIVLTVVVALGAIVMVYPLIWLMFASVKPADEIFTSTGLIPQVWDWGNYVKGWAAVGNYTFGRYFANSLFISVTCVLGNAVSCSLAAFAFGRLEFPFKRVAFALMMVTIMLPAQVTIIPQFILFNSWGWVNTYWPLILPKFFATDAFFIFLMVQFVRGIPRDLDDAAQIDGCNAFQIYWRIILPLLRPALVTTAIFTFLWTYNDFFSPLIYLSQGDLFTVPLALRQFLDTSGESLWGPMFAMSALSLLPTIVVFAIFQRLIVDGISTSGLKG